MYKILISGYYGFNNIGDESILKAVTSSLKAGLTETAEGKYGGLEITVLSSDPVGTAEKYQVRSANRKSIFTIIKEVMKCDLLISGGGSLLQDVTSKKSILYYLFIMWMAKLLGKNYFIYSQGIGPINEPFNRKLTHKVLSKSAGIVVRDEASKEFLVELGIHSERIVVTADPVLSLNPTNLDRGFEILKTEGLDRNTARDLVGFAIKEKKPDSEFVEELTSSVKALVEERNSQVVLIPFFFKEDMAVIEELEKRLIKMGMSGNVCAVRHKYLTDEMMSIIGNMDVLVGVRLHSLIHAALMGVPMIGISYDPKINSFMKSLGMRAICSIYDFTAEYFLEEYDRLQANRKEICEKMREKVAELKEKLYTNENMIRKIMEKG